MPNAYKTLGTVLDIYELNQMKISTQRLRALIRMLLDASTENTMMTKSDTEVRDLEENKVQNKFYTVIDTGAKNIGSF